MSMSVNLHVKDDTEVKATLTDNGMAWVGVGNLSNGSVTIFLPGVATEGLPFLDRLLDELHDLHDRLSN
jgi:hypothetical protein